MTREDYIKKAYEDDNTLDPSSIARGWSLKEQSLRDQAQVDFKLARPQKYKRKEGGKIMKVVPLYLPIGEDLGLDFNGLLRELAPEMGLNDVIGNAHIYKGLMMHQGYLIENHNRCYLGIFLGKEKFDELFEHLGDWQDSDDATEEFKPDEETV